MNALTTFLQADWAERAGWALLHSLWQIAAVAAVYAIAAFLLRGRSADSRYVLGCVAILAMLGLPIGTYALLSRDVPLEIAETGNPPAVAALPTESPSPPSDLAQAPIVSTDPLLPIAHSDPVSAETVTAKTVAAEAEVVPTQPATTDLSSALRRCLPWATAAWLMGVMLLSFRPLWGWFHVRRLQRHGLSPLSDTLRQTGQRVMRRLRVNRAVQFAQSALVEVPTVVGCLRPMILLPVSAITGLSAAEIELILAHELAHVRRHDWLVNLAQTVIEALLFYHPGMWWVSNQIRQERENCCDDMAVAVGGSRTVYVQALARLEEQRSATPAVVLAATGGALLTRVRRLLGKPANECGYFNATACLAGPATLSVVALVVGFAVATGGTAPSEFDSGDGPGETIEIGDFSEATADRVVRVIEAHSLPFINRKELDRIRGEFRRMVEEHEPEDLSDDRKRAILTAIEEHGGQHLHLDRYRPAEMRCLNLTYLSLPDRLDTLQWKLYQAMQRGPLNTEQTQRLEAQRKYMRRHIASLPEDRWAKHEPALSRLEVRFSDPLSTVLDRPMTEEQFSQFKEMLQRYPRDGELRYVVPHIIAAALKASHHDFKDFTLPGGDRVVRYGHSNTVVRLGFESNAKFRGDTRGLDDIEETSSVIDAVTGYPETAPVDAREPGKFAGWLDQYGKGDFGYDDAKGGGLFAVRGAKLALLDAINWIEADAINNDALRAEIKKQDKPVVGLKTFYEAHRDVHKTHPSVPYIGPYIGVLTKEGHLAVVHVEDFNGRKSINIRTRPRDEPSARTLAIIDTSGKPIAGARVQFDKHVLVESNGRKKGKYVIVGQAVSNTEGYVEIPSGAVIGQRTTRLWARVEAEGYVSRRWHHDRILSRNPSGKWYTGVTGGVFCRSIVLLEAGSIAGRVLGPDGKSLAGAPLSMTTDCDYDDPWRGSGASPSRTSYHVANHLRAISDENGEFRFENVPPGKLFLYYPWDGPTAGEVDSGKWRRWTKPGEAYPSAPTKGLTWTRFIRGEEGRQVNDLVVDLSKSTCVVEGRVVDADGTPVVGARVEATWKGKDWSGHTVPNGEPPAHTDANGLYRLTGLPPSEAAVFATLQINDQDAPRGIRTYRTEVVPVKLLTGRSVTANLRFDEKIDTSASDSASWGKAVDGVRVRLTKATAHWERSDRPLPGLRLFYDAKNEGPRRLYLLENGLRHQVEVDGQWYEWIDPRFVTGDFDGPSDAFPSILLDFEPGRLHEDKRVDVAGNWRAIPKGRDHVRERQARRAFGIGRALGDDYGRELVLTPGKHRVRVAVICTSGTSVVRAVSEAVEVEVAAAPGIKVIRPMDSDARQPADVGGVTLHGTVLDTKTGKPIAGATIEGADLSEWADLSVEATRRERVLTDSRGRYVLRAAKGGPDYRLGVHASGYAPQWLDLGLVPGTEPHIHDFKLTPGGRVYGVVTDEQKRPLAGATVTARTAANWDFSSFQMAISATAMPGPPRRATTDAAGRFEIVDLPEGQVQLSFSAKHRRINDKNYAVGEPLKVVLSGSGKPGVLQVRAIDAQSGKPISAFHITRRHDPAWHAVVKADGRFRLPGERTRDRAYSVYVYAEGYAPAGEVVRAVAEDSDEYFTVRLTPAPAFVAQLVDAENGKPIAKAKVMCGVLGETRYFDWNEYDKYIDGYQGLKWVQRAVSGDDGMFTFAEGGEAPKGELFILAEGYQRTLLHTADRAAADAAGNVVVRLQPQATLSGVLTQAGRPLPNVEVGIWKHQVGARPEQEFERIATDAQGRFRFENLEGATYSVSMDSPSLRISRRVVVDRGSDTTVALGADLGPHSLHGKSIPHARITIHPQFDWDYRVFAKTADASGNYRFVGLRAGTYSVDLHRHYPATGYFLNSSLPPITIRGDEQRNLTPAPRKKSTTTEREDKSALPQQQAINRMLQPLLSLRSTHPEMARFREDVKHDVQVVDGRVRVSLSYEHNYVAGTKTKPAGPKAAGKPWCRLAVLIRPDTGEATQLEFTDAGQAARWDGQVNTRGYRVASPPMLITVAVETGSPELQRAVNRIIDTELTAMLRETHADNEADETSHDATRDNSSEIVAARPPKGARPMDADARQQFLAIERLARLPMPEQAKQLPRLYKDLAPRYMNLMVEGLLSVSRPHILDPGNFDGPGGNTATWAGQLADAASEMTPEQVADKLEIGLWLNVAARARAIEVFKKHADATAALIEAGLKSKQTQSVERAAATILALDLRAFTDRLLTMYIEDADPPEEIFRTLLFLRDPPILRPLLEEVGKDPKFLVRCAGLFQGPLYREPAEPLLLELLKSSNTEIRYGAVRALYECSDEKLAQPAVELASEKETRLRSAAAQFASNLPQDSFEAVRGKLLPLLSDKEESVRFAALRCFCQQKDLAAGPVIIELLRRDQIADQYEVTVMQAMSKLAGSTFNYSLHNWGPGTSRNRRAIEKFEAWLRAKKAAVSVAGRVIGIDGKPAVGYRVTALPEAWSADWGEMPSTTTDEQGAFSFRNLPDGPCDVAATSTPLTNQPNMRIEDVPLKKGKPVHVELSLEQKYSFGGRFLDNAGKPQPNRSVLAIWKDPTSGDRYSSNTKTDAKGRYRFASPFEVAQRVLVNDGDSRYVSEQKGVKHGREDVDFQLTTNKDRNSKDDAWGKAIDGVQCRLETAQTTWNLNSTPQLNVSARTRNDSDLLLSNGLLFGCELEVNGKWHEYWDVQSFVGQAYLSARQGELQSRSLVLPLQRKSWRLIDSKQPLELKPGKHQIRFAWAAYRPDYKTNPPKQRPPIRLVSNPVDIEIVGRQAEGHRESKRLVVDLINAVGIQERPSFWIGRERLTREALLDRLGELRDKSPTLRVAIRHTASTEEKELTALRQSLAKLNIQDVSIGRHDLPHVFAYPNAKHNGTIRGRVVDAHPTVPSPKYRVMLWNKSWETMSGVNPELVVGAGEAFEFRNVGPGDYELRTREWQPNGRVVHFGADWTYIQTKAAVEDGKVAEVQVAFGKGDTGRWSDAYTWGEAVEGLIIHVTRAKFTIAPGEKIELHVDIRNGGKIDRNIVLNHEHWELEIDGKWLKESGGASSGRAVYLLEPKQAQHNVDVWVWLGKNMTKAVEGLPPGKHTLRVAHLLNGQGRSSNDPPQIRVVSQPVIIEVVAEDEGEGIGAADSTRDERVAATGAGTAIPPPDESAVELATTRRVIDAQGSPIAGAKVGFYENRTPRGEKPFSSTVTDEDGKFPCPDQAPDKVRFSFYLVVSAPGFRTGQWLGHFLVDGRRIGAPLPDTLRLDREVTVSGVVLGADGKPLAGVSLAVDYFNQRGTWANLRRIESDEQGRFKVDDLPPADIFIRYEKDKDDTLKGAGGAQLFISHVRAKDGQQVENVVVDLSKAKCVVEGQVVDHKGNGIEGASVKANFAASASRLAHYAWARTDRNGRYRIEGLPPHEFLVSAWSKNHFGGPGERVKLEIGETKTLRLLGYLPGHPAPEPKPDDPRWGKPAGDLRAAVELRPGREAYSMGEIVEVRPILRNTGGNTVTLIHDFARAVELQVTDEAGKAQTFSYKGFSGITVSTTYVLEPGHEVEMQGQFSLKLVGAGSNDNLIQKPGAPLAFALKCRPGAKYKLSYDLGDGLRTGEADLVVSEIVHQEPPEGVKKLEQGI